MSYILEVKDLVKSFGDNTVLNGISFSVEQGEVVVIIGPSGTGKSTLLRCINCLTPPDSGQVWLDGIEVTDPHNNVNILRQDIGFVFQHFALFKHLTAFQNVMVGLLHVKKMSKQDAQKKAEEELRRVGLLDHMHKYPAELSGGQQQRVGIARSLAMDPKVML
ncbi:MAG: amino acid ABC transporter ATP-binding protein, partial [Spirochaetales bacterium]|nr:amino acid ABC transporter ATP-binding protein [Spirochaetales bacterium]